MKIITNLISKNFLILSLFIISLTGFAQHSNVTLANATSPTPNTFEVDVVLNVLNPAGYRLASVAFGINYAPAILNGGLSCTTINCGTWTMIPGTRSPAVAGLNQTSNTNRAAPVGHLRATMTNLTGALSIDLAPGSYTLGRYRFINSTGDPTVPANAVPFIPGSNANLWLQNVNTGGPTNTIVSFYPFGLTTPLGAGTTTSTGANGSITLGYTSTAPLSLIVNTGTCFTSGSFTETPVTCFGGSNGTATVTMSPIPSNLTASYVLDSGASVPVTLSATGAFTISGLTAGAHTLSVTGSGTCTTPVAVPFTITGPTGPLTNTTTITECNSYTWTVTGTTYNTSGQYTGTTVNGSGCTVNETLNLTISPAPVTAPFSVCQGGTVVGGLVSNLGNRGFPSVQWYTTPTLGTAIGTGSPFNPVGVAGSGIVDTNTVGSTIFYAQFPGGTCRTPAVFTVSPITPVTTTITACNSYTWAVNGTTYTTGGTYTFVTGCTTETLNLTINAVDNANLESPATTSICLGGTFIAFGQVYEAGVTDPAGQAPGIDVEFGISPSGSNTNPSVWTNWTPATFNVQVGINDQYQITTGAALAVGTYYYTFRYKLSTCTAWQYGGNPNGFWNGTTQNSGVLTVNPIVTPTFTQVTAICSGGTLAALPTTSTNSINGNWAPAVDNTTTTTYTFTPTAGQCATTATMTITVTPNVTPVFTQIAAICNGATLAALPTTSNNGVNGSWAPAPVNTATTTYTFTPSVGVCATTATMTITVNPNIVPTFTQVAAICNGGTLAALPLTSLNGISGTWAPALNTAATTTYTFTRTAGQCATTATMTITVNPNVTPTFTQVAAICSGGTLAALPLTSLNGITGTWAPALNTAATTTYTFTRTPGLCATTATMTITVTPNVIPTFTQVAAICNGGTLNALPTTSNNAISGTWAPALNTAATTTYTFTPTAGICATTATMTITVNPNVTPTFTQVAAICNGGTLSALPITSNNAIGGTWAPALNTAATTTYTFTPTAGLCATTATMTITVNPTPATPTGNATQTFNVINLNDATIANLVVAPTGVIWYGSLANAQTGTNPLAPTTVITNGSTYWAVNVVGTCTSLPFAVVVSVVLGNDEFDSLNFSFYPNPTSSILNISYSKIISEIQVINLLGQEVIQKRTNETDVQIDLTTLAEATYFVKVTSEGKSKIIKVIKRN